MDIRIYRNQIKYEVDIETRKAGLFRVETDNMEQLNEAQMGMELNDKYYFERKAKQGVDDLLDVLHRYVISCVEETGEEEPDEEPAEPKDNALPNNKSWLLSLNLDDIRRSVNPTSLASLCHKYIAYNILYSWAVMVMPSLANEYKDQRQATYNDIQRVVYRKEAPVLEDEEEEDAP